MAAYNPVVTAVGVTLHEMVQAADAAFLAVPCVCPPNYYERRRTAPDCFHHDLTDQFEAVLCAACKRTRSWRAA